MGIKLAVIDTNVLVASLLTKNRDSATIKILDCISEKKICPVYNDEIISEEVSLTGDSYLVTGNIKHFPATPKVVTPAEMIAIIEGK